MKSIQSVPRELVERKPKHGEPRNHCGLCCWSKKCDVGRALFGDDDKHPCPALGWDGNKSYCNVLANPQGYIKADVAKARKAALLLLYAGQGCTMRINGEMNAPFARKLEGFDRHNRDHLDAAA